MKRADWIFLLLIFLAAFLIRVFSVYPSNTIVGYDQVRDLFESQRIYKDLDLKIIGPTAGNNPNLHHGVLYLYYILSPLFFSSGDIMTVVYWNIFFNALTCVVIFFLSLELFKNKKGAFIAAILTAISSQLIQFSGWLSNPTASIITVPLYVLFFIKFVKGDRRSLIWSMFFLGLSIQFELFFIYLIPVTLLFYFVTPKRKVPTLKTSLFSVAAFCLSLATMILTEIKFHFAGFLAITGAGDYVGGKREGFLDTLEKFITRFFETFNISGFYIFGYLIGFLVFAILIYKVLKDTKGRENYLFLLIYLLSPVTMLLLGYHNAPWFLIALPAAVCLSLGYVFSLIKNNVLLITIVLILIYLSFQNILDIRKKGQQFLEPDLSANLSTQLKAVDYTYTQSQGDSFVINTVTNPLYINALWAYHYKYYGEKKYGYLPTWGGGDQIYPYDTLQKENNQEKYLFLIIDKTYRISLSYTLDLMRYSDGKSLLLEEKEIGGFLVQKRRLF